MKLPFVDVEIGMPEFKTLTLFQKAAVVTGGGTAALIAGSMAINAVADNFNTATLERAMDGVSQANALCAGLDFSGTKLVLVDRSTKMPFLLADKPVPDYTDGTLSARHYSVSLAPYAAYVTKDKVAAYETFNDRQIEQFSKKAVLKLHLNTDGVLPARPLSCQLDFNGKSYNFDYVPMVQPNPAPMRVTPSMPQIPLAPSNKT
jgi:hypothetical protein